MKKIYLATILLLASVFVLPQFAGAVGQMTKPIIIEDILRAQTVEETLTLYGSDGGIIAYELSASGDIKNWTSFYLPTDLNNKITNVSISGTSAVKVIAKFTVPGDTPNGVYNGKVTIASVPEKETNIQDKASATVSMRIGRNVSITVTDKEIVKFTTAVIPLKYAVANGDPMKIKIIYSNQGNVLVKPTIDLKILRDNQTIFNAIYPYPEGDEGVKLFSQKEIPLIEWPTGGQSNGTYQAQVKVLLNNVIQSEHQFTFDVGHDMAWYLAALASMGPGKVGLILIAIGVVLMGIFAVRTFVFKKKDWELATGFFRNLFS